MCFVCLGEAHLEALMHGCGQHQAIHQLCSHSNASCTCHCYMCLPCLAAHLEALSISLHVAPQQRRQQHHQALDAAGLQGSQRSW